MTRAPIRRKFDPSCIPPEVQAEIETLELKASNVSQRNVKEFDKYFYERYLLLQHESERQEDLYPPNPPNNCCHHALINGVLLSTKFGKTDYSYEPFFQIGPEKTYVWNHTKRQNSVLISDVDSPSILGPYWKTLSSIIEITYAISTAFEWVIECNYDWIYYFDPKSTITKNKFLYQDNAERLSGCVLDIAFFFRHAQIMELLHRDECFYVMCMNLIASFYNHKFCLQCAFRLEEYQMHENHEVPCWNVAQAIPQMEVAIVQATRTVEAALGKPGDRKEISKYDRVVNRWTRCVNIDPNAEYSLVKKRNIDYYYDLFGTRGRAAHSLGKFPYEVSRQLTIEAQCFAWSIIMSYLEKHELSLQSAQKALQFNEILIS